MLIMCHCNQILFWVAYEETKENMAKCKCDVHNAMGLSMYT